LEEELQHLHKKAAVQTVLQLLVRLLEIQEQPELVAVRVLRALLVAMAGQADQD
jgi:hypothetical protein